MKALASSRNAKPPGGDLAFERPRVALLVEDADDESPCVREQVLEERSSAWNGDAIDVRADDVECMRWLPLDGISHPDPIGSVREPDSSHGRQLGRDLQPVGLDPAPVRHALHEETVGAADIEECLPGSDGIGEQ